MSTADAVRRRLGLGRLLPLGEAGDGAWLTEQAAEAELRLAAEGVATAVLGTVRLSLADPEAAGPPAVPPPPSALSPGPLRITAEFAATARQPLPDTAAVLRDALFTAARRKLDLLVSEVDLRATDLFDAPPAPGPDAEEGEVKHPAPVPGPAGAGPSSPAGPAALAASTARGVAYLTDTLGAPVHASANHVRVEVAVARGHRPLDAVRAVREAVSTALGDDRPVSVLVTAVGV
ncbi:hypothetical protein ACWEFL_30245 [Streptomyces sp. NPDC004838]